MTPEKTKQAFDTIATIVLEHSCVVLDGMVVENRLSPEDAAKYVDELSPSKIIEHLYFMAEEGKRLVDQGRIEKAMRWLGFLQGALWGLKITTIGEQKNINRPDDVTYDGKRI